MKKLVPCGTFTTESEMAVDGRKVKQIEKNTIRLPLEIVPAKALEDVSFWWTNTFDIAKIDWKSKEIVLAYSHTEFYPTCCAEYMTTSYSEVIKDDEQYQFAPSYLLKELNAGAENQVVPKEATLEALCMRCGLNPLETMIYLREEWMSEDDIGEMIYNYYD